MMALKIDMSKGFDKGSWDAILKTLSLLGSNDHYII